MKDTKFDYENFEKEALTRLEQGGKLEGPDGVLAPLLKRLIEASLEGEMDAHQEASGRSNRRNGRGHKKLSTPLGEVEIRTPRDREGSFEPELVPKRQRSLGDGIDRKILSLYGKGFSYRDIREHLRDLYGLEVSTGKLSAITDRVIPELEEWQNRPLEAVYPFVWLDAVHFKVRVDRQVKSRAVYCIIGVNLDGEKDVLGMYVGQSEKASFWAGVLGELRARGVEDILIACTDNLKGFAEAIEVEFPETRVQLCVIHQIRNSRRYVSRADWSDFSKDLRQVYKAVSLSQAEQKLEELAAKWKKKYPSVINSWLRNWPRLSAYFDYPPAVRKVIYTTNIIEGYHRQLRKVTKTKGAFSSEKALEKALYLAYCNIAPKWKGSVGRWNQVVARMALFFPERIKLR